MSEPKPQIANAVAMWDFRSSAEGLDYKVVISQFQKIAKRFVFQLERGSETGYLHFQGRFSLIKKHRKGELLRLFDKMPVPNYLEPTVNANFYKGDMFYVTKDETREDGPWDERETEKYIPVHFRGLLERLLPFQKTIYDSANVFDSRSINMVVCSDGNRGKSTVGCLSTLHARGVMLPPVNDAEKLMQSACDIIGERGKRIRNPSPIFIDLPRAMGKDRLNGVYSAVEQIKTGYLYDMRFQYKEWWIDSPQIWVFSNVEPDLSLLSKDRWKVWTINEKDELVKFVPQPKVRRPITSAEDYIQEVHGMTVEQLGGALEG